MNPIYKFELSANGTTQRAYPIYNDSLAKDFEKESGQEFFRAKLSGELTFESEDYQFIVEQSFDEQFELEIFISYDAGVTWASYWTGTFWKTDCKFDDDAEMVVVKPTVLDHYNDVLAGLDKEYNLIDLAPEIVPVKADKRPMVQVYVPGQTVIGCFLSGMWWEQECEAESDESKLTETGDGKLNFSLNKTLLIADVSGEMTPALPDLLTGTLTGAKFNLLQQGQQDFNNGTYILRYIYDGHNNQIWAIVRVSDSVVLWQSVGGGQIQTQLPITVTLNPVSGNGATGNVTLYVHQVSVYSRYMCDTSAIGSVSTYEIGTNDIVPDNRNYRRVIGYYFPDTIFFSSRLTVTPTQWGLYQPGQYYQPPYYLGDPEFFPVARNAWGRVSLWFAFSAIDWLVERSGREQFTIRHAYPIYSVISVLLEKIAPNITHEGTTDYSQFLYGTNIIGIKQTLLITPKSNIVNAGYDQPAQSAPITLRAVLDMLRDCFRCYWFVDDTGKFRVEHIQFFRNGGSYSGSPVVGIDLTTQQVPRNGKPWAFARNQYKFNKPEMAARYQFGWMDDVTQLFDGFPIDIISKYVNPDNIEQINISRFTSDIDYILLNPGAVSKDGFILLAGMDNVVGTSENAQNGYYVQYTTGALLPVSGFSASEYIPIIPNSYIKISYSQQFAYYDKNKNYVSGVNMTPHGEETILVPGDCYYMRCSIQNTNLQNFKVVIFGLPYLNYIVSGNDHYLQNAYVAFCILQEYYAYDMPAPLYSINGDQKQAQGIKKLKNQTIQFPVLNDPNLVQLVKTNLGNGAIEKLSVNLSSRNANATLIYDTE